MRWEVHEHALQSTPPAPHSSQRPAAQPPFGSGPPDQWARADGRRLPWLGALAGGVPRFDLGDASRSEAEMTPDARGLEAGGSGLQRWQQDRFFLSSPSTSGMATTASVSLPPSAAAAARYCI
jgi:hypothetical protein